MVHRGSLDQRDLVVRQDSLDQLVLWDRWEILEGLVLLGLWGHQVWREGAAPEGSTETRDKPDHPAQRVIRDKWDCQDLLVIWDRPAVRVG